MNISSLPRIKPLAQGCPCGASAEDALCDAGLALRRWALPGRGLAGLGDLPKNGRWLEEDWRALFLLLLFSCLHCSQGHTSHLRIRVGRRGERQANYLHSPL